MKRTWLAAALILPLAGLLASIGLQEVRLREATTWRIPITGYDPRDLLQGRYIQFSYAWTVEGDKKLCASGSCLLCLENGGTHARIVARDTPGDCPAMVDPRLSGMDLWDASRIYVSETSAPKLEARLRKGPMVVVTKLTRDGRLVNERLEPAP